MAQNSIGNNSGNLLYLSSVHSFLSTRDTDIVVDGYGTENTTEIASFAARVNEEFDHLVLPLANAFRRSFLPQLRRMTAVIERLSIPVTVIGVGAQHSLDAAGPPEDDEIDPATRKFVAAVLARSATIGVRGHHTAEYLHGLGFSEDAIDVIGCPSMYQGGRDLRIVKKIPELATDSLISVNATDHIRMGDFISRHASRFPHLVYIGQDRDTLRLLLWGQNSLRAAPGIPHRVDDPLYRSDRIRYFVNSKSWIDFMSTLHFSFGSRIHGNIAAMLGGTPAMVLAHDSRTRELAEFFQIPVLNLAQALAMDAPELYEQADFTGFNRDYPVRFDEFCAFLERNGLPHRFQADEENPAYDAALDAAAFPGSPHALGGRTDDSTWRDDVTARLAWLRGGAVADAGRWESGGQRVAFPASKASDPQAALRRKVAAQGQELASQREEIRKLSDQLAKLRGTRTSRPTRRLRRALGRVARRLGLR